MISFKVRQEVLLGLFDVKNSPQNRILKYHTDHWAFLTTFG